MALYYTTQWRKKKDQERMAGLRIPTLSGALLQSLWRSCSNSSIDRGVLIKSEKEAEALLGEQITAYGEPQWEYNKKFRFNRDMNEEEGAVTTMCASCDSGESEPGCLKLFQLKCSTAGRSCRSPSYETQHL